MIDSRFGDSKLVSLYQSGNEEAFEVLLNRHKSRVYTAIYLIVKDRYIAEGLVEDTRVTVINTSRNGRHNEEGQSSAWLSRATVNLFIDCLHRRRCSPECILEWGSNVSNPVHFFEDSNGSRQIGKEKTVRLRA